MKKLVSYPPAGHGRRLVILAVALAAFALTEFGLRALGRPMIASSEGWVQTAWLVVFLYGPRLLIPVLAASFLFGPSRASDALGLNRSLLAGLAFAALASAPMGAALAVTYTPIAIEALPNALVRGALAPGVTEEISYRAFLFGMLFRFVGVGFLPAALSTSMIFGFAHYAQGSDVLEVMAVAGVTGFGGLWFAWLFTEWRFNIWIPIGMHVAMNGWWELFAVSNTALGSPVADASRVAVILLSILITLVTARRRGGLVLNWRSFLWVSARSQG